MHVMKCESSGFLIADWIDRIWRFRMIIKALSTYDPIEIIIKIWIIFNFQFMLLWLMGFGSFFPFVFLFICRLDFSFLLFKEHCILHNSQHHITLLPNKFPISTELYLVFWRFIFSFTFECNKNETKNVMQIQILYWVLLCSCKFFLYSEWPTTHCWFSTSFVDARTARTSENIIHFMLIRGHTIQKIYKLRAFLPFLHKSLLGVE